MLLYVIIKNERIILGDLILKIYNEELEDF